MYGFNKKTMKNVINILKFHNQHNLIPLVTRIFTTSKDRIIPCSKVSFNFIYSKRTLATVNTSDGDVVLNIGKNKYIYIHNEGYIELRTFTNFPIGWYETYILKQPISTRYNKLKGLC